MGGFDQQGMNKKYYKGTYSQSFRNEHAIQGPNNRRTGEQSPLVLLSNGPVSNTFGELILGGACFVGAAGSSIFVSVGPCQHPDL